MNERGGGGEREKIVMDGYMLMNKKKKKKKKKKKNSSTKNRKKKKKKNFFFIVFYIWDNSECTGICRFSRSCSLSYQLGCLLAGCCCDLMMFYDWCECVMSVFGTIKHS